MLHRRPTALVAVLLPLAAALTSCGFDYPTDRVNTIAAGVNNREASVDVLGARILAFADGQGRLIGTFVNSDGEPAMLTAVDGPDAGIEVEPGLELPPNESVNLAADDTEPIVVTGDFSAGDVITLTYTFSTAEVVGADVPVVKPCGQYAGIAEPDFDAAGAAEDDGQSDEAPSDVEHADETAHGDEAEATYLCEHPTETAEEEGGH